MPRRIPSALVGQIQALVLMLASAVCMRPAVAAAEGDPPPTVRYALAAWSNEQSGDVLAITQDLDGYLWLGTPDGLVRFDGTHFQRAAQGEGGAPRLGGSPVVATSSQGGIWMGFGNGRVVRFHRGVVASSLIDGDLATSVNALIEDRRGSVWAATGRGLFRMAANGWSRVAHADGHDGDQTFSVYEDRAGRVWAGTARGVYRHDGSTLQLVDATATYVDSLAEDFAGNVWVTDRVAIVRRLGMSPNALRLAPGIRLPLPGWRVTQDGRGGLLVASFSGGLFRVSDPAGARPALEPVEYEDRLRGSPRALYRDRENNVWVGMRGGLLRLSENTFQTAGPLEGLNHDGVRTAEVASDGSVWIATTQAVTRLAPGSRRAFGIAQPRALHADRAGDMWVATDHVVGRYTMGRFVQERIPEVQASRVNALTTTEDGLWLCTAYRGVVSWDGANLTSHRKTSEPARGCSSILTDRQGRVWAGFGGGGVTVYEPGNVRSYSSRDGLSPGSVWQIAQGDNDAVWVSTSGGVNLFRQGRLTAITTAHAPITGVVPVLVLDGFGYVWLGIQSGAVLMRFHTSEMDRVAEDPRHRVAYTLYNETDGLEPGTQVWQSGTAGVRDQAGRVWVVDGSSMTIIDPRLLREPRRTSTPGIDAVSVNGERVNAAVARRFANGSALQIDYAALSLTASSKLRFRHLLEGVDADWVYDAPDRRAMYTGLRAGDYRFRVAATEGGPWTEGSLWAFTINPPFYLTRWFLLAMGTVLLGGVAVAARLRVRAVKTRYALVIAERTRLSREIHDTLLQSLAALGPELETLATRVALAPQEMAAPGPDASRESGMTTELRRLRRQVERSVRDARASILELRRHPMSTPRLAESLVQFAGETEARHGIRPTVAVVGRRPDNASPDVDLQLFRIAQEAVTNAVRHGHATRVDINVTYEDGMVTVRVTDNGCGFDTTVEPSPPEDHDHFGLVTMRERAEQIGGELRIESTPGTGTTVYAVARLTNEWS